MITVKSECYCALCRNKRTVYAKRSLSLVNYLLAAAFTVALTWLLWHQADARGLLIYIGAIAIAEIFILLRRRTGLACPHCGFDPVLYSRNQATARDLVIKHLETRQEDPNVWLARRPPIRGTSRRKKNKDSTREIIV